MTSEVYDDTDKCLRCGLCCHYIDIVNGVQVLKRCKRLKYSTSLKSFICSIYGNRLGRRISKHFYCSLRRLSPIDYPGCPYNTNKPYSMLYVDLHQRGIPKHDSRYD